MNKKIITFLFLLLGIQVAIYGQNVKNSDYEFVKVKQKEKVSKKMKQLIKYMSGSFNSSLQSKKDKDFFDISLHVVPIWKEKEGESWLYVEQALTAKMAKPYRLRVYRLIQINDSTFMSEIYLLPHEMKYAGAWRDPRPLANLNSDSLIKKVGCEVYLVLDKGKKIYKGKTKERNCKSTLKGANYATTQVTITDFIMESWDRGYNESGEQVWGAVKSGYKFVKLASPKLSTDNEYLCW
jgi:CpeT protein